jgi:predicted HTH transcriptional regulator
MPLIGDVTTIVVTATAAAAGITAGTMMIMITTITTTTATAKRDLSELVKDKVLVQRGKGRSISYVLSAQLMSRKVSRKSPEK